MLVGHGIKFTNKPKTLLQGNSGVSAKTIFCLQLRRTQRACEPGGKAGRPAARREPRQPGAQRTKQTRGAQAQDPRAPTQMQRRARHAPPAPRHGGAGRGRKAHCPEGGRGKTGPNHTRPPATRRSDTRTCRPPGLSTGRRCGPSRVHRAKTSRPCVTRTSTPPGSHAARPAGEPQPKALWRFPTPWAGPPQAAPGT